MKVITKDQFYLDQIEALKKRITQEREGVEEFKQMMNDAFKDLEAERDALAAQVEVLRDAALLAHYRWRWSSDTRYGMTRLMQAVKATPAACLAHVRAEAVLEAVKFFHPSRDIDVEALESYAKRIRQGGAE